MDWVLYVYMYKYAYYYIRISDSQSNYLLLVTFVLVEYQALNTIQPLVAETLICVCNIVSSINIPALSNTCKWKLNTLQKS